ncbi:MAG TPA: S-ribosylhomocysteine lyase [Firmicutes bacterium]|nr:S-ribosylhomocysteine lyase [Bacillota bacterium]HHT42428.1 S-ribosylhomocysteine lyase [Bacillota bacterium]
MNDVKVESFSLDHTTVSAPHVRQAEIFHTPKGDVITKYDLRFTQPNQDIMPTGAVHALEHLLAGFLREELDGIIDLSPMGCRTGFYLIRLGQASEQEVAQALVRALDRVLGAKDVPARSPVQCGNYRDLSLFGAQEYAKTVRGKLSEKYPLS